MDFQTQSHTLEKLYENIKGEIKQISNLEDFSVTTGAVPLLAISLYSLLNPFEQIAIIDRLSGTYAISPKHVIEVQLGKIKISNELTGIELVRQFEDCRGCVKIPGCDRVEVGSILFTKKMCTGYTNQEVVYYSSMGQSGNCEFRFLGHHPSKDLCVVEDFFFGAFILPHFREVEKPSVYNPKISFPDNTLAHAERRICQLDVIVREADSVYDAVACANILRDAYLSLIRNISTK